MAVVNQLPQNTQIIVTLDENAVMSDVRKALKMIRGVSSVRVARISDDHSVSPALRTRIKKAREESAKGETIVCNTPEEMLHYFDSL